MPELINEEPIVVEKTVEKKPLSALVSAIVAIAIGSSGGFFASQELADNAKQEQIAGAKIEIAIERCIMEKIVTVTTDTIINGTAIRVVSQDTLAAYTEPIMARYAPEYVTAANDTFIVTVTKKVATGDSMAYYGVYCPTSGKTPVFTGRFLDVK